MLPRATNIHEALRRELELHDKALEVDVTLTKIHFEVVINHQTGLPARVRYQTHSETDLTVQNGRPVLYKMKG